MGGIDTDISTSTCLPGLYAAGECACVSINGAHRLGSNSLSEILVFGARAGKDAVRFAKEGGDLKKSALEAQGKDEQNRITKDFLTKKSGSERIASIRADLYNAMETGAGIYRDVSSLQAACNTLGELVERCDNVQLDDRSNCYNTELTSLLELHYMLDVAEALVFSALARTESRGSHQRTDYPERDDENFLKHSLAYYVEGGPPRIEYKDVVITKWPPGERVYGAESGKSALEE